MTSYEQRDALLEFQYRKPDVTLPEIREAPETVERLTRVVFDHLQRSNMQLREHVNALEARNKELEDYAHTVAHDLKEPLTALIWTADLIKDVHDLTGEELSECLLQLRSTAYEMKSIVKNLLLFAEVSKVEAPRGLVHMAQVVANVKARLGYMIKEKQAQLILPEVWPDAFGYGPWIEEVWANFLSNASSMEGVRRVWNWVPQPGQTVCSSSGRGTTARASLLKPVRSCLHEATRSAASVRRETGWVCRLCTTLLRNWVVR